jgi:hypothetical protein
MAVESFFEAVGPVQVGFVASTTAIDQGANITGNSVGIIGVCGGPSGFGVEGFGSGSDPGVAGFGASGSTPGAGVFGRGVQVPSLHPHRGS